VKALFAPFLSVMYQNPAVFNSVLPEDFSAGKEIGRSPKTR
jgi:hypothetical protein